MNLRIYNINSIKFHKDKIFCLLLLKDKRLISSSKDFTINIYNNISFEKDFSIKNDSAIYFITQLKNEKIISCDFNSSIKIYILFSKSYNLIQIIKQNNNINKIIELNNLNLISC
jgi:WD40 repeat protein